MTVTKAVINLNPVKAPALPLAPGSYDPLQQEQFLNALRLYFRAVDNWTQVVAGPQGGRFINSPCGEFICTTTQTQATINTPKLITLDTTNYYNGMYREVGDGIHVEYSGVYNVQFSAQVTNTQTQPHDLDIWIRKNGSDVANTASVASVVGTHGGQPGYMVMAANFFVPMEAGDYLEFWWAANSTSVELNYLPAITTPFTSPGAPSFVVTLSFVSSLTV